MPIRRFLAGKAFDPDQITAMSRALETVCDGLRLKLIDDEATRLVAEKIIELAQHGVSDADALASMVLTSFQSGPLNRPDHCSGKRGSGRRV